MRTQLAALTFADVAQLAEQSICNRQVTDSSPVVGFGDGFLSLWDSGQIRFFG